MKTTKLSTSTDSRQAFLAACADNRGKLLQAIKDGFSFVIRLKDEYLLFKSQSEMESVLVAAGECMGAQPVHGSLTHHNVCWYV